MYQVSHVWFLVLNLKVSNLVIKHCRWLITPTINPCNIQFLFSCLSVKLTACHAYCSLILIYRGCDIKIMHLMAEFCVNLLINAFFWTQPRGYDLKKQIMIKSYQNTILVCRVTWIKCRSLTFDHAGYHVSS